MEKLFIIGAIKGDLIENMMNNCPFSYMSFLRNHSAEPLKRFKGKMEDKQKENRINYRTSDYRFCTMKGNENVFFSSNEISSKRIQTDILSSAYREAHDYLDCFLRETERSVDCFIHKKILKWNMFCISERYCELKNEISKFKPNYVETDESSTGRSEQIILHSISRVKNALTDFEQNVHFKIVKFSLKFY